MALRMVIGFKNGHRPFIGLDNCQLNSKYLGILLPASTLDGNNRLFWVPFEAVKDER